MITVTNDVPISQEHQQVRKVRSEVEVIKSERIRLTIVSPHLQYSHPRRLVRFQIHVADSHDGLWAEFEVFEGDLLAAIKNAANCVY